MNRIVAELNASPDDPMVHVAPEPFPSPEKAGSAAVPASSPLTLPGEEAPASSQDEIAPAAEASQVQASRWLFLLPYPSLHASASCA